MTEYLHKRRGDANFNSTRVSCKLLLQRFCIWKRMLMLTWERWVNLKFIFIFMCCLKFVISSISIFFQSIFNYYSIILCQVAYMLCWEAFSWRAAATGRHLHRGDQNFKQAWLLMGSRSWSFTTIVLHNGWHMITLTKMWVYAQLYMKASYFTKSWVVLLWKTLNSDLLIHWSQLQMKYYF